MKRYPFDLDRELLALAREIRSRAIWGGFAMTDRMVAIEMIELCESVGLDVSTATIEAIRAIVLGTWDLDATLPPWISEARDSGPGIVVGSSKVKLADWTHDSHYTTITIKSTKGDDNV